MVVLKKEDSKINKVGDKFLWKLDVEQELTVDEFNEFKGHLERNIKSLKEMLNGIDIDAELKKEEQKLDNEYKIQDEANKNFDKYIQEQIKRIKDSKPDMKKKILNFLHNFDDLKKNHLEKKKAQLQKQKEAYEIQLKNNERDYKIYQEAKE